MARTNPDTKTTKTPEGRRSRIGGVYSRGVNFVPVGEQLEGVSPTLDISSLKVYNIQCVIILMSANILNIIVLYKGVKFNFKLNVNSSSRVLLVYH